MDNKPKQKPSKDSFNDENDRLTNPNRRQDEEQDANVDRSGSGQRASNNEPGSRDDRSSDRLDESQRDRQQTDTSRRQRQTEE